MITIKEKIIRKKRIESFRAILEACRGLIFSPDKSLPEYDLPILVLILGSLCAILFSSKNKRLNLFYLNR